ncbi:MAG: ComF family protein [Fodinibius sp.]|nr:ComF family protein [Fodinibius sp.]
MTDVLQHISEGLSQVVFPNVCACCGRENTHQQRQLCSFCLHDRFEDANPDNDRVSSDSLLPNGIVAQQALWQFDKGGDLQHLLHQLKYYRLTTIGMDLDGRLGQRIRQTPRLARLFDEQDAVILPVPLHYKKYRYRGFNQAFKLAQGFKQEWKNMNICDVDDVVRTKNTASQTGFSLEKRLENMDSALSVQNGKAIRDKLVVIVDDVFTTGATTFELSQSVLEAGAGPVVILTIAQA